MKRIILCPECKQGKHANCDGTAWDKEVDAPTKCGCTFCGSDGRVPLPHHNGMTTSELDSYGEGGIS